jgi:putative membrane protein
MIPNFTDHAANERTYLAWVRTALAIIGLGFLLERFDLFLASLAHSAGGQSTTAMHLRTTEWVGLILIAFGTLMIFLATLRFIQYRREITSAQPFSYHRGAGGLLLAAMLIALGMFLLFYIGHELLLVG